MAIQDDIDIAHRLGKPNNRPRLGDYAFREKIYAGSGVAAGKTLRLPQEPQAEIHRRFDFGRQDAKDEAVARWWKLLERKGRERSLSVDGRLLMGKPCIHHPE